MSERSDFRDLLTQLEQPETPSAAVLDRVEHRMLEALHSPEVVELETVRGEQRRRQRWTWVAAAAASILAVVAVATIGTRNTEPDTDPAVTTDLPVPSTTDVAPAESNVLGYEEFRTLSFGVETTTAGGAPVLTDRLGALGTVDGGRLAGTVRRVDGTELVDLDIMVEPDGSVVVPLEFIDPPTRGGRCLGGTVPLALSGDASTATTAICDGTNREVSASSVVGPASLIPFAGSDIEATPLTVTIDDERTTTLWFGSDGLLRFEFADGTDLTRSPFSFNPSEDDS